MSTKLAGTKVKVNFDVLICKKTGEITIKMKEGLCKFQVGNSSLSEILNSIALGYMGADINSISQKLNEFGKSGSQNSFSSPLTSDPVAKVRQEEEEIEERQKIKLGNV